MLIEVTLAAEELKDMRAPATNPQHWQFQILHDLQAFHGGPCPVDHSRKEVLERMFLEVHVFLIQWRTNVR
jgi:hypothetical protein